MLWGACDPLTTPRPLGPLHDLADQLGDGVADAAARARGQPHEIFAAVFEHLRLHPSVLVVDDLHWADQGTIDLLRFLLRRIRITGSLVVGAAARRRDRRRRTRCARCSATSPARPTPTSIAAAAAERRRHRRRSSTDRPVDPARLHRLTGGNPFFVVEMLDHDGGELPRTVRDAILARTTGLDADAWDLLHLLACAPEAIPDQLLAAARHRPARAARRSTTPGSSGAGPRGVAFRHDLCRMAIAGTLPPGGEVALHRRMLDALEASRVRRPGRAGPPRARRRRRGADRCATPTDAGRAAARSGAHTQAAAFFRIALDQRRARVGRRRGRAARAAGRASAT